MLQLQCNLINPTYSSLIYIQIMELRQEQPRGKINYKEKNLDYIQRLKEKKQREMEQKVIQQRKQQHRRQTLKRKILQQASKNRQNRLKDQPLDEHTLELNNKKTKTHNFESLPKITPQKQMDGESQRGKKDYQQRYLTFLKSLHHNNKSKKEIQEVQKKKKEDRANKMKQELGYTNVQSKLSAFRRRQNSVDQELIRSHSAQKFQSLIQMAQNQMPKTNKNFKRKNEQYIQKIKKKRAEQQQMQQQQKKKKQKLKQKLKDFVMVTVKKNVMEGVYDQQFEKKAKRTVKEGQEKQKQSEGESGSQQSDKERDTPNPKPRKMRKFPYVTDLTQWRKKNRLVQNQKVFIITGGYPDLKRALRDRGWVQNPDVHSPCFDLKFTLQGRQINHDQLLDFQLVNHYQKNGVITTKLGLTKSMRNSMWINDISQDTFFPKCFDLNDQADYAGFQIQFKLCKALSILKIYVDSVKARKEKSKQQKKLIQDLRMRTQVAINVCLKNIQDLDDIIDMKKIHKVVTDKQWEILASDQLTQESLARKKHQQWLKSIDCKFGGGTVKEPVQKKKKKKKKAVEQGKQPTANQPEQQQQQTDQLLQRVLELLQQYKKKFPQYCLTQHNNIWILKPAGLSRGRGITCYNNFVQIQDHIRSKQSLWIAQKYIQNPLVVLRRKFDIRQWVLITDFNPLTIWYYEQCYIRFSAIDYDPKQVNNKFIHLTNNSIGAYYKDFQNSHIKGNMFFQDDFKQYLQQLEGYDVFEEKIRPRIKEIIKMSMKCALDGIQNRKNSHELFGYDFMVDTNYQVWLIQINSSPSMDYSTHVTTKLVKEVMQDTVKVIVDYPAVPKKDRKGVDTGKFKKIYKGIEVNQKLATAGLNLTLQGVPMRKPKRNTVKIQNFNLENK